MAPAPALAQATLWTNYEQAGAAAYKAGKFKEAERLFTEAVQAAKNIEQNDGQLAQSYNDRGAAYRDLGKFKESEEILTKAISLIEKTQDPESGLMAYALNNLANVYLTVYYVATIYNLALLNKALSNYKKAEELNKTALDECEKVLTKSHTYYATGLTGLADCYIKEVRYKDAESTVQGHSDYSYGCLQLPERCSRTRSAQRSSCDPNANTKYKVMDRW